MEGVCPKDPTDDVERDIELDFIEPSSPSVIDS